MRCPVCGKTEVEENDVCPVCHWANDPVQLKRPDVWGRMNGMSLNQARDEYRKRLPLILASGSPRRKELLSLYRSDFIVCVSDFDESTVTAGTPAELVERLARGKCSAVAEEHPGALVLGCDTVVDVKGEVFGKPRDAEDARRMLHALSGTTHEVHTGVCVSDGVRTESFVDSCKVTFFPIEEAEIERYITTEEPYDKAGAYAIQGRAALWLDRLEGDYYTIMGLPVSRTAHLLESF